MDKSGDHMTLRIGTGSIIKTLLIIVSFLALFYLRNLVLVVLAAVVIASSIEPATRWFVKNRIPRAVAVILIYAAIILILVSVFYFVVPPLLGDTANLLSTLPKYLNVSELVGKNGLFGVPSAIQGIAGGSTLPELISGLSRALGESPGKFLETIIAVSGGVLSFFLIVVLSFYLSAEEDGVVKFLRLVTPLRNEEYVVSLWRRSQTKIGLWMQGQLLLALLIGVLVFLGLTVLGVRHALPLAFLSALFEIIPIFGPILSAVHGIAVAVVDGGLTLGLLVVGLYVIIQQFESNLIYPLVVKKVVGVPPLLVILALIVGFQLGGFLGALLSIPIAAALVEYLDDVVREKGQLVSASRTISADKL